MLRIALPIRVPSLVVLAVWMLLIATRAFAAGPNSANLTVTILDKSHAYVSDASSVLLNTATGVKQESHSNKSGTASFPFLTPGKYTVLVHKNGFASVSVDNVVLNVGDDKTLEVTLQIGPQSETVTVNGDQATINTTDASVSTVIDRTFVENIPLNGRSFQDLVSMTPGVVTASPQTNISSPGNNGDFSINGQRTESNYYLVDGVAANVSAGPGTATGYGAAGVTAATSALGTTQSLLSVDDLQEFRVESSSYSAEYGRSPGGQLTFVTRSGTNAYHGSAYDYFRNGWFDANDWFNDNVGAPKEELHQNDFGGTFGGPVWIPRLYNGTNKTFFFGSYEGLRLAEPQAATVQYVPDAYMREQAPLAIQPLLNAFPLPSSNGTDYGTSESPSLAQFYQGYSLPGSINSSSIRIDQTFTPAFSAFFRFADTPSSVGSRSFSILSSNRLNVQTYTLGTTNVFSHFATNQFRLGYSRSYSASSSVMDSFGGAIPIDLGRALGNTTGKTGEDLQAEVAVVAAGAGVGEMEMPANSTKQHQWNVIDTLDIAHRTQQWKFGFDFRQISSQELPPTEIIGVFEGAQSVLSNSAIGEYSKTLPTTPVFNQLALFAQDSWRINGRISLSGGLRWELLPPPHNATNPQPYAVIGNVSEPSTLNLAPAGTPIWHTSWFSFAPRLGIAWQVNTSINWETVARIGGGVFFDTVNQLAVNAFTFGTNALGQYINTPLPLTQTQQDISITTAPPYSGIYIYPSHLQNPYTLQWNTSVEQGLGANNIATISYIGSAGRRLAATQELSLTALNPLFQSAYYTADNTTSDYDALQVKFQRSVTKGLNALASYTWAHSIDYGSNASALPLTRGDSDFDVRNNFQLGATYELPTFPVPKLTSLFVNGWSFDGRLLSRTSFPVTLQGNFATDPITGSLYYTNVDLVPGKAIYLHGSEYPGGRSLNPAAFAYPTGTNSGTAPRNLARGFGESQVNFSAKRDFALSERLHLQFRAEAFNIFNHPNFGYVDPTLTDANFGQATMMLNQSLGTVASQYQQGGPRSMQFSLRLAF